MFGMSNLFFYCVLLRVLRIITLALATYKLWSILRKYPTWYPFTTLGLRETIANKMPCLRAFAPGRLKPPTLCSWGESTNQYTTVLPKLSNLSYDRSACSIKQQKQKNKSRENVVMENISVHDQLNVSGKLFLVITAVRQIIHVYLEIQLFSCNRDWKRYYSAHVKGH